MRFSPLLLCATAVTALVIAGACGREAFDSTGSNPLTPTPTNPGVGNGGSGPVTLPSGGTFSLTPSQCEKVVSASNQSLTFSTPPAPPFAAGALLLVLQVQDSFATVGDQSPLASAGSAGLWSVVPVSSSSGAHAVLGSPLPGTFASAAGRRAQACSMPQFSDVALGSGATLTATAWNGTAGGVVAFLASGTLTVGSDALITAAGRGFRGGPAAKNNGSGACGTTTLTLTMNTTSGGGRGESLDANAFGQAGRGNLATGGGGTDPITQGGGGGGNGGAGGLGGIEGSGCQPATNTPGGLGAAPVTFPVSQRLTFGGGGGGGAVFGLTATAGAAGGGLVLIFANHLAGGGTVDVSGGNAAQATGAGGGGGGAGGTLSLSALQSTFTGTLRAAGGSGGIVNDTGGKVDGPGGGGGGGRVRTIGLGGSPAVILVAGTNGYSFGSTFNGANPNPSPHGALPGTKGILETD